jgi:hypothetical protein
MDLPQLLGLAAALGFASGVRLYAVLFVVGLAGLLGWLPLPHGVSALQHPIVLCATGLMAALEFFADKVPAIDSLWDAVHTFIRIPAGAALAAGLVSGWSGGDPAVWTTLAALLGGTLAATSHAAKSSARAAVNTSPEPFSNLVVSTGEDLATGGLLWLALANPWLAGIVALVAALLALWLVVRLWRFFRAVLARLGGRRDSGRPRLPTTMAR